MELSEYLPFWSKLSPQQQEQVRDVAQLHTVKKGTRIHDSSEECLGLVILHTGQLRAYILSEDGREITIGRLFDYDVSLLSASCVMPRRRRYFIRFLENTDSGMLNASFYELILL